MRPQIGSHQLRGQLPRNGKSTRPARDQVQQPFAWVPLHGHDDSLPGKGRRLGPSFEQGPRVGNEVPVVVALDQVHLPKGPENTVRVARIDVDFLGELRQAPRSPGAGEKGSRDTTGLGGEGRDPTRGTPPRPGRRVRKVALEQSPPDRGTAWRRHVDKAGSDDATPISGLRSVIGKLRGRGRSTIDLPGSSPVASSSTSKSAPAQKPRPAPVRTIARTSGSASAASRCSK